MCAIENTFAMLSKTIEINYPGAKARQGGENGSAAEGGQP